MKSRAQRQQELKTRLDELQAQIDELEQRTRHSDRPASREALAAVRSLKQQAQEAERRISAFETSSHDTVDGLTSAIDLALGDLKSGVDSADAQLRRK